MVAADGSVVAVGALLGTADWLGSADGAELVSVDGSLLVLVLVVGSVDDASDGLLEPLDRPSLTWVIVVP